LEVYACAQRTLSAKLAVSQSDTIIPHNRNLLEFLEHGIEYAFVPDFTLTPFILNYFTKK